MRHFLLFILLPCALTGCQQSPPAHNDGLAPGFETAPTVGGWQEQSLDWETARQDFERLRDYLQAEDPSLSSLELIRVETQVVSGYNLRLTVRFRKGDRTGVMQAIFYHDIHQNVSLDRIEYLP